MPVHASLRPSHDSHETSQGSAPLATILAMARLPACIALLALAPLLSCTGSSGQPYGKATPTPDAADTKVAAAPAAPTSAPKPEFVHPEPGEIPEVVLTALQSATADGRQLVVYIGASWCEPCQAFHDALERGELDGELAGVRFLEFDSDEDGDQLRAAGYGGRLIPRFVTPGLDGRAGDHRMEGGIKGAGAVANIMERLTPLLARAKRP